MTVREIIYRSLRMLGVLASGETPAASDTQDALTAMNAMIKSWSNNGFMIFENQIISATLLASQDSYTIGATGDVVAARPVMINEAKIIISNCEYDIEIINEEQYANITDKSITGSIPTKLYYNPSYPNGTLYLWPKPEGGSQIKLYCPTPVASFTSINNTVSLPDGYEDLLAYATADRIAPEYGKELSPRMLQIMTEIKADIMRKNTTPEYMTPDPTGAGGYHGTWDIETGDYR